MVGQSQSKESVIESLYSLSKEGVAGVRGRCEREYIEAKILDGQVESWLKVVDQKLLKGEVSFRLQGHLYPNLIMIHFSLHYLMPF